MIQNIIINKSYFCGHGLVVEHVLAKDETRVRFSLAAQFRVSFRKASKYKKMWITMLVMFIKDTRLTGRAGVF